MCEVHSEVSTNQFKLFQLDYVVLQKNHLGLPNCLHCGEEPLEIHTMDSLCEHIAHLYFRFCYHTVGITVE
jgi:hypothetical protein